MSVKLSLRAFGIMTLSKPDNWDIIVLGYMYFLRYSIVTLGGTSYYELPINVHQGVKRAKPILLCCWAHMSLKRDNHCTVLQITVTQRAGFRVRSHMKPVHGVNRVAFLSSVSYVGLLLCSSQKLNLSPQRNPYIITSSKLG